MALKLSVKIGDVTNLSDARYAAGMGVDYIGFNIDATADIFLTPTKFKEIINWVSGVGIIGEVGITLPENLEDYPSFLTETSNPQLVNSKSIFRFDAQNLDFAKIASILKENPQAHFYVIALSAKQIELESAELAKLCLSYPIYFATNFNEQLLEQTVSKIKPKGIEIKGGLEDQPGFKDYDGIADVLEWLEVED